MTELLGVREYARHRGCSHSAVLKAITTGRILDAVSYDSKNKPRINAQDADRLWAINTQSDSGNPGKLADARAFKETYKAKLAKLDFDEREGALVRRDEVDAQAFRAGKAVKDSLLAIPARLAELVAAEDDAAKCRELIESEIRQSLEELEIGLS